MRDPQYEDYLKGVLHVLEQDGFEINSSLSFGEWDVDYYALKREILRNYFINCFFAYFDNPDPTVTREYSTAMYHSSQHLREGVGIAFPILCSKRFTEQEKEFIRGYRGTHDFMGVEHPVLMELYTKQLYHCEDKPLFYRRYSVKRAVDYVPRHFAFSPYYGPSAPNPGR